MKNSAEVKYARNGDVTVAYSTWGRGKDVVVFTPPLISNVELMWDLPEWERLFEWAGKYMRVVIMDKRGVGLSDRLAGSSELSDHVSDVLAVMDAEGLDKANIAGQSEGGAVGIALAAGFPGRVQKLCLIGTTAFGIPRSEVEKHLLVDERLPGSSDTEALWREIIRTWGTKESICLRWFAPSAAQDARVQGWWNRFERQSCSPGSLVTMVRAMAEFDLSPLIQLIQAPTLVCHASGDRISHISEGRALAALIPGAEFRSWENHNHLWGFGSSWRDHENDLIEFFTGVRPPGGTTKVFGCILFTDVVGSTEIAGRLGDAEWRSRLEIHDSVSRAAFRKFGGNEIKQTGDGFLVIFASPLDAAQAAVKLVHDLDGSRIPIRAGMHMGQIETHDDGDVSGIAVNIASRVQSLAEPMEVLVSQTVRDLLMGSGLRLSERGTHALKGVDGSWTLYSLED